MKKKIWKQQKNYHFRWKLLWTVGQENKIFGFSGEFFSAYLSMGSLIVLRFDNLSLISLINVTQDEKELQH